MIKLIAMLILFLPVTANAETLLTITYGGTVSVVKGLTKKQCEFASNRALGKPATKQEKRAAADRERAEQKRIHDWFEAHPKEKREIEEAAKGGTHYGACGWGPYGSCLGSMPSAGDIKSAECF